MTRENRFNTMTGFFESRPAACDALARLVSAGISLEKIELLAREDAVRFIEGDFTGFLRKLGELLFIRSERREVLKVLHKDGFLIALFDLNREQEELAFDILDGNGWLDEDG